MILNAERHAECVTPKSPRRNLLIRTPEAFARRDANWSYLLLLLLLQVQNVARERKREREWVRKGGRKRNS